MAAKKEVELLDLQALTDKLKRLGYPDFEVKPGEDKVMMLYIQDHLIGGANYALSLKDDTLKAFIDETVAGGQS